MWEPLAIADVAELFAPLRTWWIAGGHAIDLFVGRSTRPHEDIDVQLLRADESRLRGLLTGWELFTAQGRRLAPWRETDRARLIWCRRSSVAPWALEVLLADTADDRWVYRRDPRITRQVAELGAVADEVPYLRPEIQLLFKSKMVRPKDEADFQATLPLLDDAARDWLQDSLAVVSPGHPWLDPIRCRRH